MSIREFFFSHPESVGETYFEHARAAGRFGITMILGGAACLVHAALPALFPTSASRRIRDLHAVMSARGQTKSPEAPSSAGPWALDYQI